MASDETAAERWARWHAGEGGGELGSGGAPIHKEAPPVGVKARADKLTKGQVFTQNGVEYTVLGGGRKIRGTVPKGQGYYGGPKGGTFGWLVEFVTSSIHGVETRYLRSNHEVEIVDGGIGAWASKKAEK